jgi:hypothetical protein
MRGRLLRIGVLAAALFAINVVARLVARFAYGDGTPEHLAAQDTLSWIGWGAVALVMAVTAAWWARQRPQGEVAGELAGAAALAGLLYVVVGPFVSEPPRFEDGVSGGIVLLAIYLLVTGVGALVGMLLMIAAGLDYKSKLLKRYAQSKSTRPRRAVRG